MPLSLLPAPCEVGEQRFHVEREVRVDALERVERLVGLTDLGVYARTKSFFDARLSTSCFLSFLVACATWKNVSSAFLEACLLRLDPPHLVHRVPVDRALRELEDLLVASLRVVELLFSK